MARDTSKALRVVFFLIAGNQPLSRSARTVQTIRLVIPVHRFRHIGDLTYPRVCFPIGYLVTFLLSAGFLRLECVEFPEVRRIIEVDATCQFGRSTAYFVVRVAFGFTSGRFVLLHTPLQPLRPGRSDTRRRTCNVRRHGPERRL